MNVKVIRRIKLTELINPVHIHSIMVINGYYGRSLAIAISNRYDMFNRISIYGPLRRTPGVYYIPLDKFTYGFPSHVAIPKESYSNIILLEKEFVKPSAEAGIRFTKATITKKITW